MFRKIYKKFKRWWSNFDASAYNYTTRYMKEERNIYNSLRDLERGRSRIQAAYYNNEQIHGAINNVANMIVGGSEYGVKFQPLERRSINTLNKVQREWENFIKNESVDNEDSCGMYGYARQLILSTIKDGFVFFKPVINEKELRFVSYEANALAVNLNEQKDGGGFIRLGCEYDTDYIKRAFWIRQTIQDGIYSERYNRGDTTGSATRMPADEFFQIYMPEGVNMPFGVPTLFPSLLSAEAVKDFRYAELRKQRLASSINAFTFSNYDEDDQPLGDITRKNADIDNTSISTSPDLTADVPLSSIQRLDNTEKVEFPDAPRQVDFKDFYRTIVGQMSMSLGISVETLMQDFSNTSFSSARMAQIQNSITINNFRKICLERQIYNRMIKSFLKFLVLAKNYPTWVMELKFEYIPPAFKHTDPIKQAKADQIYIQTGTVSVSELIRGKGKDPEKVLQEIQDERSKYDFLNNQAPEIAEDMDEDEDEDEDD